MILFLLGGYLILLCVFIIFTYYIMVFSTLYNIIWVGLVDPHSVIIYCIYTMYTGVR